ncbi:MAG: tRNA (adenosine(37)-N6)-threonylcarbamoyltransferase complex ATPase subunit type 1 TsaE [Alphaproteobacteria bacterium]|nr:MAG: tRNA (adenosine(37)-N6)-threonylcarbamoyltransferase complex ATPase subunit type 1 TsaE [Alphaproteobacteria bacterium]
MMIETCSEQETIEFAHEFAKSLAPRDVVLLHGDLGMGKSVFSRAVIRGLCGVDNLEVPSPTFTLVQTYDADIATLWHFDLYRLSDVSEIYELGWEEALIDGVLLVEWPERLGYLRPNSCIDVILSPVSDDFNMRKIEVVRHG